jgi:hypothetical protein
VPRSLEQQRRKKKHERTCVLNDCCSKEPKGQIKPGIVYTDQCERLGANYVATLGTVPTNQPTKKQEKVGLNPPMEYKVLSQIFSYTISYSMACKELAIKGSTR